MNYDKQTLKREVKQAYLILDQIENKEIPIYSDLYEKDSEVNIRKRNYNKFSYLIENVIKTFNKLIDLKLYNEAFNLGLRIMGLKIWEIEIVGSFINLKKAIKYDGIPVDFEKLLYNLLLAAFYKDELLEEKSENIFRVFKLSSERSSFIYNYSEVSLMEFIDNLDLDEKQRKDFILALKDKFNFYNNVIHTGIFSSLISQLELQLLSSQDRLDKILNSPDYNLQATLYTLKNDIPDLKTQLIIFKNFINWNGALEKGYFEIANYLYTSLKNDQTLLKEDYEFWLNRLLFYRFISKPSLATLFELLFESTKDYREDLKEEAIKFINFMADERPTDNWMKPIYRLFLGDYSYFEEYLEKELWGESEVKNDDILSFLAFFLLSNKNPDSKGLRYAVELLSNLYNNDSLAVILMNYPYLFNLKRPEELQEILSEYLLKWKSEQKELPIEQKKLLAKEALPYFEEFIRGRIDKDFRQERENNSKYLIVVNEVLNDLDVTDSPSEYIDNFIRENEPSIDFKKILDKVLREK